MRHHDKPWDIHWILGYLLFNAPLKSHCPNITTFINGDPEGMDLITKPVVGFVVFDVGMGGISGELNQKSREIVRW